MKNKKLILTVLIITVVATLLIAINNNTSDTPTDYSDMVGLDFPKSFDEYIFPYGEIDDYDLYEEYENKYNILYKEINNDFIDEKIQNKSIEKFNKPLREMGLPLPFISFSAYLNSINNITEYDKTTLLSLYEKYSEEEEDYQQYEDQISDILRKYQLNGVEVLDQLNNFNYKYVIFTIKGKKIKLDESYRTNDIEISKAKEKFYRNIIDNVFFIAPSSIKKQINTIEFSTDGLDRSLAYVVQNDDYTKFRLSIDEKDAVYADGNFTRDGLETLIHEFAHIITLNRNQVYIDEVEKENPDISKSYKPSSYLNTFYNLFWKDIYDDYQEENNSDFYEEYKDQFVSDYAATHIDEDIAESFMFYVFDMEVEPDTIAYDKVNFFNNYPEMIELKRHFKKYI